MHGRRGDRFVYLTWGDLYTDAGFEMFRRAKLMLDRIDPGLVRIALETIGLAARVDLTASDGGPRCARVDATALLTVRTVVADVPSAFARWCGARLNAARWAGTEFAR